MFRFPISRDPPEGGTSSSSTSQGSMSLEFPISRDPPEGGTSTLLSPEFMKSYFQFLGIPPKGEQETWLRIGKPSETFPISRDPPEGGTPLFNLLLIEVSTIFPISRDPPEGGTGLISSAHSS